MQVLYVAQFDVARAVQETEAEPAVDDVYHVLIRHLSTWLGGQSVGGPSVEDLETPGSADLTTEVAGVPSPFVRQVKWQVQGTNDVRALRLDVNQPLAASAAQFVNQVTIATDGGRATMRVAMGREITGGWLSPARVEVLHRPRIISNVARDATLDVRVLGQQVDGRFEMIHDVASVQVLSAAIQDGTRLPIIVLHPRSEVAWDVTHKVTSGLLGLASVVILNYTAGRALADLHPDLAVPDGGARLIWPDPSARHPRYARVEVEKRGGEGMRALWMELLAELSVVARGSDLGWDRARRATQNAATQAAAERLRDAHAAGDLEVEVEALAMRVSELTDFLELWEDEAQRLRTENDDLRSRAENFDQTRRELNYWKRQYYEGQGAPPPPPPQDADPWAATPTLLPTEASPTYRHLEVAADRHIAFTPAAETSWEHCDYPNPQEMTDILVTLAKAVVDLYTNEGPMPYLDDWFKQEHGINVAMSDNTIKKAKVVLRYFTFEGAKLDQTPHVKVRDGVKPNEVGRIHFPLDAPNSRLVVNHVGLKLYGI